MGAPYLRRLTWELGTDDGTWNTVHSQQLTLARAKYWLETFAR